MLKDILFLTKKVFDKALIKEENLPVPKKVYDVYRNLKEVISDVNLVANHYLALDFSEPYLENAYIGELGHLNRKHLDSLFKNIF